MHKIILGSIEVLHELVQFIQQLNDDRYLAHTAMIDEHVSEVLSIYQALMHHEHSQIDYCRDDPETSNKQFETLKHLVEIENWLMALNSEEFQTVKVVKVNMGVASPNQQSLTSTLARELCFASNQVKLRLAMMQGLMTALEDTRTPSSERTSIL